jgi:hypothetical protein
MDWKDRIGGCFGVADFHFAIHSSDQKRAFQLLTDLRNTDIGWTEVEAVLRKYLEERTNNASLIEYQLDRAAKLFKPWLND